MYENKARLRADNAGYYTKECVMLQFKKRKNGKL